MKRLGEQSDHNIMVSTIELIGNECLTLSRTLAGAGLSGTRCKEWVAQGGARVPTEGVQLSCRSDQ
jgi:hypothetical protein